MLTRRGFLQVLGTAMAGAAVFEPKSLLWVPKPKLRYGLVELIPEAKASALIDEQLELNDLARRIACEMAPRLERSKAIALSEVMYRHTGSLTPGMLHVLDQGDGYFVPALGRLMVSADQAHANVDTLAGLLAGTVGRCDMFAPIGEELRPGEPFSGCAVGIGSDPETGLSVRVLRYEMDRGHRRTEIRTGAEMAGGAFHMRSERRSASSSREFDDLMNKAWPYRDRDKEH